MSNIRSLFYLFQPEFLLVESFDRKKEAKKQNSSQFCSNFLLEV